MLLLEMAAEVGRGDSFPTFQTGGAWPFQFFFYHSVNSERHPSETNYV